MPDTAAIVGGTDPDLEPAASTAWAPLLPPALRDDRGNALWGRRCEAPSSTDGVGLEEET